MEICHLKNAELEPKHHKYKERVVLRGDIVKDDSAANGIHRTSISSFENDSRISYGCHCEITRMRWTSRRRSVSLHPEKRRKLQGFFKLQSQNVHIYMDTSSTT